MIKTIPQKEMQKCRMVSEEAFQIAVKRRDAIAKEKRKDRPI